MNVVFSKKGFLVFCKQHKHESFEEILTLFRRGMGFKMAFSKSELYTLPIQQRNLIMPIIKRLGRNRHESNIFEWNYVIPKALLERNYHQLGFDELSAIYFLTSKGSESDLIKKDECILCVSESKDFDNLTKLFIEDPLESTFVYTIDRDLGEDWNLIKKQKTPSSEIIIVDGFLFGRGEIYYEKNFLRIIQILADGRSPIPKNLIIFTFREAYDKYTKQTYMTNAKGIQRKIENIYKDANLTPPNIKIILMPQGTKHERTIITNYKQYINGDTFNLYDVNGNIISCDEHFTVRNYTNPKTFENLKSYLLKLQNLILPLNQYGMAESSFLKTSRHQGEAIQHSQSPNLM